MTGFSGQNLHRRVASLRHPHERPLADGQTVLLHHLIMAAFSREKYPRKMQDAGEKKHKKGHSKENINA